MPISVIYSGVDNTSNSNISSATEYDMGTARTTRDLNPVVEEFLRAYEHLNTFQKTKAEYIAGYSDALAKCCAIYTSDEATTTAYNKQIMACFDYYNQIGSTHAAYTSINNGGIYQSTYISNMPLNFADGCFNMNGSITSLNLSYTRPNGQIFVYSNGRNEYFLPNKDSCNLTWAKTYAGSQYWPWGCIAWRDSEEHLPREVLEAWQNGDYVVPDFAAYKGNAGSRSVDSYASRTIPCVKLKSDKWNQFEINAGTYQDTMIEANLEFFTIFNIVNWMQLEDNNTISWNPLAWLAALNHTPENSMPEFETEYFQSAIFEPDDIYVAELNDMRFILMKKTAIEKWFSYAGIPFAWDTTDAQKAFEDIEYYDPDLPWEDPSGPESGQPTNTFSDWTGTGDNSEDTYILKEDIDGISGIVNHYALNKYDVQLFQGHLYNDVMPSLWSDDPKENVLSLRWYPFDVYNHDATGFKEARIQCGNHNFAYDWAYRMEPDYIPWLDLGTFEFDEYFGGFLDYKLTYCDVYLPYIGWRTLPVQNIMGRTVSFKYAVDFVDGSCACYITSTGDDGKVRVENIFEGKIGIDVPLLASNAAENSRNAALTALKGAIGIAGSAAAGMMTGGTGAIVGLGMTAASTAADIAGMEHHTSLGGSMSATLPMRLPQHIIIRITRPTKAQAEIYPQRLGYPANFSVRLGDVHGFTQIDNPFLDGITLHENEKEELKQLLKEGVIL